MTHHLSLLSLSLVAQTQFYVPAVYLDPSASELLLIPALLLLAVAVGRLPALTASRTDVAASLGK